MGFINNFFGFLNSQILQMKWLSDLVKIFVESVLNQNINDKIGGSIHFFIYDSIKILILLSVLTFTISYIQSYFTTERAKKIMLSKSGIWDNIVAALLGTVTPFCSCSSIPLFIGFTEAGLPVGVTFSFLISSPLVDLAAFVVLISIFGIKFAVAYVVVGIILAVIGGKIIDKLNMQKYVKTSEFEIKENINCETVILSKNERLVLAKNKSIAVLAYLWKYVLLGVAIGSVIHNIIPKEIIENILGNKNPFSVIIATLVGVPIYADELSTIPVAEALFLKGVGVGTVLSFMMAVTALSLPSLIMLLKVVKPKLLITFTAIITIGIIIIGYLFNAFSYMLI